MRFSCPKCPRITSGAPWKLRTFPDPVGRFGEKVPEDGERKKDAAREKGEERGDGGKDGWDLLQRFKGKAVPAFIYFNIFIRR